MNCLTIPGIGLDADKSSDWPGERSLLVPRIGREQAIAIGRSYQQLAIIWCPESAIPELLMLGQQPPDSANPTKL